MKENESNNVKNGKTIMKYSGSLYVCKEAQKTKDFYTEVLGVRVIQDFGANFTFTGGFSFQTVESWTSFISKKETDIAFGSNNAELYFECEDLDAFIQTLEQRFDIEYVHPIKVHDWGQRGIRIFDPNGHIIEISETLSQVCVRFMNQGFTIKEISQKTMLSEKMVKRLLNKRI